MADKKLEMANTNSKKNYSLLLSGTIPGFDTLILCLGEVLHLLGIKRGKSEGMRQTLFPEKGKRALFKTSYRI